MGAHLTDVYQLKKTVDANGNKVTDFNIPEGYMAVGSFTTHLGSHRECCCELDTVKKIRKEGSFGEIIRTIGFNKPYFDIEWYGHDLDPILVMSSIMSSISNVVTQFAAEYNVDNPFLDIKATKCNRVVKKKDGSEVFKHSYHLIVNCSFYFKGPINTKFFKNRVVDDLKERSIDQRVIDTIDNAVYGNNNLMRLIFNYKYNDREPTLYPIDPHTLEFLEVSYDFDEVPYYISYIPKEALENMTCIEVKDEAFEQQRVQQTHENPGNNRDVSVMNIVKDMFPKWKVVPKIGRGIIGSIQSRTEACEIHGYVHSSQNMYYTVKDDVLIINCHSPKPPLKKPIEVSLPTTIDIILDKFDANTTLDIHLDHIKEMISGKEDVWGKVFYKILGSIIIAGNENEILVWNGYVYIEQTLKDLLKTLSRKLLKLREKAIKIIFDNITDEKERKAVHGTFNSKSLEYRFKEGFSTYTSLCQTKYKELLDSESRFKGIIQLGRQIVMLNNKKPPLAVNFNNIDDIIRDARDYIIFKEPDRDILVRNYVDRAFKENPDPEGLVMKFFKDIHSENGVPNIHTMIMLIYAIYRGISRRPRKEAYFLYGRKGNNGKSTLFSFLSKAFGSQVVGTGTNDILSKPGETTPGLVKNKDKSLLLFPDLAKGYDIGNTQIKELVSGGVDAIQGRALYQGYIEFIPKFTIMVNCNNHPKYNINDVSMDSRIVIIPYVQSFQPPDRLGDGDLPIDPYFIERIENEFLDDLLSLIIQIGACIDIRTEGHVPLSEGSINAKSDLVNSNPATIFIQTKIESCNDSFIPLPDLRVAIGTFCADMKIKRSEIDEEDIMRNYHVGTRDGVIVYEGVKFK